MLALPSKRFRLRDKSKKAAGKELHNLHVQNKAIDIGYMNLLEETLVLKLIYATKTDLKNAARTDTSKLAAKSDFVSLKTEVDKLDIDTLVPVLVYLSKLSDAVKNYVLQKTVCDKLVAKVNHIDFSRFVLRTKYDADQSNSEIVMQKKTS